MRRSSLFRKILLALLLIALLPLLVTSLILFLNLGAVRTNLAAEIAASADKQASENLRLQAEQVAENIANFLEECEADLLLLAALPQRPEILQIFYESRRGEVWQRRKAGQQVRNEREWIPRYQSLAIIDRDGRETFAIRDGRSVGPDELRSVADPAATEFKSEDYFRQTRSLQKGELFVSHVTGFHVTKAEQLAGAPDPESAFGGKEYRGVVRFGTPLFDRQGRFAGMVLLSLDHRHLMEFSQHILPGGSHTTVFPSYQSGNYAFLFDDEGWIITHPKFWDIRGVDREGRLVPPYTERSTPAEIAAGRIPFNLDHAGFIHPNYPVVARLVREGKSGAVDTTNVGGAQKVMAFAPIRYATGEYRRHGIFGGVTIGFQVDRFREAARAGIKVIDRQLREHVMVSALLLAVTSLLVVAAAWLLSRSITRPLALLTDGARQLADGTPGSRVEIAADDELGELARSFNRMAAELEKRKDRLLTTLRELRSSRRAILAERNFKESVLESISSAILTFSSDGRLTSLNGTGRRFLGSRAAVGAPYGELFAEWGDLAERIGRTLANLEGFGRAPLEVEREGIRRHYEVGLFPIGGADGQGLTVTLRDETERERLREEMTRMDRLASLGKLSAGIAHEVRNPLTGISLLLDDLHDRLADGETRELMGKALAEIERVEKLVAALLTFASPPKTDFREADLNRVVQDTLMLLQREVAKRGVQLVCRIDGLAPCRFDVEKVKQALLNLVKNALEALPAGGTITVATGRQEDGVTVTVADDGPGIAPADLPLIFEPFFTRKGAGTGLGLSITQRIVQEHHGRITVSSAPGEGTTFTLWLPINQQKPFGGAA